MQRAYPVVAAALADVPRTSAGVPTAKGKRLIAKAVKAEKKRAIGKKPKLAETELGKSLQAAAGRFNRASEPPD